MPKRSTEPAPQRPPFRCSRCGYLTSAGQPPLCDVCQARRRLQPGALAPDGTACPAVPHPQRPRHVLYDRDYTTSTPYREGCGL
jgi:hypothetical protein